MFLTVQQRGMLREASLKPFVSPSVFVGAIKHWEHFGNHRVTRNSAQKALRRLAYRGLLRQSGIDPSVFIITDAGRDAIA